LFADFVDFDDDCSYYEKKAASDLKESVLEFLDDGRLVNQLVGVIKEAIKEGYKYHADKADQIKLVHDMLFKGEEL
jgi:predicted nucleic-acid-binding protein